MNKEQIVLLLKRPETNLSEIERETGITRPTLRAIRDGSKNIDLFDKTLNLLSYFRSKGLVDGIDLEQLCIRVNVGIDDVAITGINGLVSAQDIEKIQDKAVSGVNYKNGPGVYTFECDFIPALYGDGNKFIESERWDFRLIGYETNECSAENSTSAASSTN